MRQLKRLTNPYRAVLGTYLHRRLFWLLAALYLLNFDRFVLLALMEFHPFNRVGDVWQIESIVSGLISPMMQIAFPIVVAVALMAQLREHLSGASRSLIPDYIRPTLRSATIAFAIAVIAISVVPVITDVLYTFIDRLLSPRPDLLPSAWESYHWYLYDLPGSLIVTCTAMTVAAWFASFGTSWITLALAPILWAAFLATRINPWLFYFQLVNNGFYKSFYTYPLTDFFDNLQSYRFFLLSICLPVLFNMIALIALHYRISRMARTRLIDSAESTTRQSQPTSSALLHLTLPSAWSRLRHLRSAGIRLAAPWIVALLLAGILMLIPPLLISSHHPEMQMQISLILFTILPSAAVAVLWSERWLRFGVESLLPASRRQFATELLAAIAIDLFHFWIAIAVAATLPLLIVPLKPLDIPMFAERLLASGLMQLIAFAALLWAMWFRTWPSLALLLFLAICAMAGPLSFSTKRMPVITISTLMPISLLLAFLGIVLTVTAYHRYLRGNWV